MITPIFPGKIEQGRFRPEQSAKYLVYLAGLEGRPVEVVVRKRRSQRSIQQNAAYWGIAVEIICNHTGMDKNEVHNAMKIKFASRVDEKTGLTIVESTAKMNTVRFIKYYEDIQRWSMAFLGCYIPDPNEVEAKLE